MDEIERDILSAAAARLMNRLSKKPSLSEITHLLSRAMEEIAVEKDCHRMLRMVCTKCREVIYVPQGYPANPVKCWKCMHQMAALMEVGRN